MAHLHFEINSFIHKFSSTTGSKKEIIDDDDEIGCLTSQLTIFQSYM